MKIDSKAVQSMPDAQRVKLLLANQKNLVDDTVYVTCFDKKDAEQIEAGLTEDERKRVRYTWLVR